MSNGNKAFSRGENLMGMFVRCNVPRLHQRLNRQRCRRQMRTEPEVLRAGEGAMSEANSLARPLTVLCGKCQTPEMFLEHRTIGIRERRNGKPIDDIDASFIDD